MLDEGVLVEVNKVGVVVEVAESDAEDTDVGDGGGSRTAGARAICRVL